MKNIIYLDSYFFITDKDLLPESRFQTILREGFNGSSLLKPRIV